jgi:hypothetical protein
MGGVSRDGPARLEPGGTIRRAVTILRAAHRLSLRIVASRWQPRARRLAVRRDRLQSGGTGRPHALIVSGPSTANEGTRACRPTPRRPGPAGQHARQTSAVPRSRPQAPLGAARTYPLRARPLPPCMETTLPRDSTSVSSADRERPEHHPPPPPVACRRPRSRCVAQRDRAGQGDERLGQVLGVEGRASRRSSMTTPIPSRLRGQPT